MMRERDNVHTIPVVRDRVEIHRSIELPISIYRPVCIGPDTGPGRVGTIHIYIYIYKCVFTSENDPFVSITRKNEPDVMTSGIIFMCDIRTTHVYEM
jgi:hypothetical protein